MNILVIPEDFRKDQYIIKPIVTAMFAYLEKSSVKVRICLDPLLGGIDQAKSWQAIEQVLDMYEGMVDMFLLLVDRDGEVDRRNALDNIEARAKNKLSKHRVLIAENAWQELEVWALAGCYDLPKDWKWDKIRSERDSKEKYFEPYVRSRRLLDEPGEGRTTLGREAGANYKRVRALCPEDIIPLEKKIKGYLGAN